MVNLLQPSAGEQAINVVVTRLKAEDIIAGSDIQLTLLEKGVQLYASYFKDQNSLSQK